MSSPHKQIAPGISGRDEKLVQVDRLTSIAQENKPTIGIALGWQVPAPSLVELRWLRSQGVSRAAILCPWSIGATNVTFNGNTFELDAKGERVLTFLVEDCGEVIDIAAWRPCTRKLATWLGSGFAIGQEAIFNPATYFVGDALHVHETPLQWLKADREGIVILRPDLAPAYLSNCQRIRCSEAAYARLVEQWLQPPKPTVEIFVAVGERGAR
jgi:hypothetical protein